MNCENSPNCPWAINAKAEGEINGVNFKMNASGYIRTNGVYEANLNFDKLPPKFHPSAISSFIVSICCGAGASMRNNGVNMSTMGIKSYTVNRKLRLLGSTIIIEGTAELTLEALVLNVKVKGNVELPDDLSGHSIYLKRIEPIDGKSKIIGVGEGSLFRTNGEEISVQIDTEYTNISPPLSNLKRAITKPEFRIATEDGELYGLTYRTRIHSIFDGINSMESVQKRSFQK
ncbi:hypothetical protein RGU76_28910 [Bacillus pseudomycoides]|uniref:hypothetical protein n=1 Tax=Bacillus TaxID=1386 RepID=UPI002248B5D2|nr:MULTISPECIES: hypothetical protein [Bacillus]MCX2829737.1 hypothetical protein [Bacillus sp. DHT2]MDR4918836.1 hypothetical protein [Bacillus pseudomycoides]